MVIQPSDPILGRAVVTGAARGIGQEIALRLGELGWLVDGVDLMDAEAGRPGNVRHRIGSVSDREFLQVIASGDPEDPPLRGWVNNAAVALPGSLLNASDADVTAVIETNLMGTYWGCAAAVRQFTATGDSGAIVNLSSIHGSRGFEGWAAYDAAKGGVEALTRNIAVEYGPVGIRANAVAPGIVQTPMMDQVAVELDVDVARMNGFQPLGRTGAPREIADVVAYLLSEQSSFVTGQVIHVDGGASSWTR